MITMKITSKDIILDTDERIRMQSEPVQLPLSNEDRELGSLTLAHSQNIQMSFMYGFFFVKFLFFTVVCVVIVV